MKRRREEGFTLIEVMVALAILGSALYILLDSHLTSLWLLDSTQRAVLTRTLLDEAVGRAEVDIYAGNLKGAAEFGPRHEGYKYSYIAQKAGDKNIPLYQVAVTVEGPDVETVTYFLYDVRF